MKWFFKKKFAPLRVDLHSHLIPGIDDGASSIADSLDLIKAFEKAGFKKLITTPHIHPKYPNTPKNIQEGLIRLHDAMKENQIGVEIEAAAEYFVDERFYQDVKDRIPLLHFGDKYVLVESSFINKPIFFESVLFDLQVNGYKPVFAHPERYQYLEGELDWLVKLKSNGILFQVTLASLSGYYGIEARKVGEELIKNGMVDFFGSDMHRISQFKHLEEALKLKSVQLLIKSGKLLNEQL